MKNVKNNNLITNETSIDICRDVANYSTEFEKNNNDLKRRYFINNILLYNNVVSKVDGYRGSFGTGYPFYALDNNLEGQLPIIEEQLRYNNELVDATNSSTYKNWNCASCLLENGDSMPDLKQICSTCQNMDNTLKPRKVINRLPDMDMWMVCDGKQIEQAKKDLIKLFDKNNMYPSDINPLKTIKDIKEITEAIKNGTMPEKMLPLDAHIIDYQTIYSLIEQVPNAIHNSLVTGEIPYLPIHPESYRKKWQQDDVPYNFIHDYLFSFTDFNFDSDLKEALIETRNYLVNKYSENELYKIHLIASPETAKRRCKTLQLQKCFKERINSWKK